MAAPTITIYNLHDKPISIGRLTVPASSFLAIPQRDYLRKISYVDKMIKEQKLSLSPASTPKKETKADSGTNIEDITIVDKEAEKTTAKGLSIADLQCEVVGKEVKDV